MFKKFLRQHNEAYPSSKSKNINERKLAYWIKTQRANYRKGKLGKNRIEELNTIDFIWDFLEYDWNNNLKTLIKFLKENNGIYPYKGSKNINERELDNWIKTQRRFLKKGMLRQDKIEKLNTINFIWDSAEFEWNKNYEDLIDFFKDNNGKYPSSESKNINEHKLGQFVSFQRERHNKGKLIKHRIEKLNTIDFIWDSLKYRWNKKYEDLIEFFKENNGKYPSSGSKESNELKLAYWVIKERKKYHKGKTDKDEIEKLNAIDFIWDSDEFEWNRKYEDLIEFFKENNGKYPSSGSKESTQRKLYSWVMHQPRALKKGRLSKEKIEKLNSIGFRW